MAAGLHIAGVPRGDHGQSRVLVRIGLGVLVHEQGARVIEQRAVPFGNRLQSGDQVGELLDMPAVNIAHDPLSGRRRRLTMGVTVVSIVRISHPREPREPLTLGQHVGGHARLA